ncbi:MAG: fumarate hydratase C-terminal domain-containing protein [Chloroflexi bacterium]|nr:fumarate hydratase C-terminal domain-containing protein [Chloroflexota bacterium]
MRSFHICPSTPAIGPQHVVGAPLAASRLQAQRIVACSVLAFAELGPEAISLLERHDFPAIVVIDTLGADLYESGPAVTAVR